jgi:hypothetical protein
MANFKTYTVKDLVASVKRRCNIPLSQITYDDNDILVFANEVMDETLGPLILSTREEFYVEHEDIDLVNGQTVYELPYRAFGSKIRILKPLNSDGKEGYPLTPIPLDINYATNYTDSSTYTRGYHLENNNFVLSQNPTNAGLTKLRLYYYLRPNDLVILSRAAKIKTIDTSTNSVTVETVPTVINSSTKLDIIQSIPNYKIRNFDLTANVNSQSKVITFTDTLPTGLQIGDYICLAGETVCPQLPADVIPILEQTTTCKVLEAQGDTEGLKNANVRLDKMEKALFNLIDNRIESPGKKINQQNSLLRKGRRRFGGF